MNNLHPIESELRQRMQVTEQPYTIIKTFSITHKASEGTPSNFFFKKPQDIKLHFPTSDEV